MKKFLFILLVVLVGCSSTEPNSPSVVGRFELTSVNNDKLPTIVDGLNITKGNVTYHDDGTFVDVLQFNSDVLAQADTIFGTYTVSGNTVTMTVSPWDFKYTAQWNEPDLSVVFNYVTFQYSRK